RRLWGGGAPERAEPLRRPAPPAAGVHDEVRRQPLGAFRRAPAEDLDAGHARPRGVAEQPHDLTPVETADARRAHGAAADVGLEERPALPEGVQARIDPELPHALVVPAQVFGEVAGDRPRRDKLLENARLDAF